VAAGYGEAVAAPDFESAAYWAVDGGWREA
jgi:hypothetical protein